MFGGGGEQVVTPLPVGAARSRDTYLIQGFDGPLLQRAGRGDSSAQGASSSNWGMLGEGTTFDGNYLGGWCYRQRGGAYQIFNVRVPITITRPPFSNWYPLDSLHVLAMLMSWPTNNWGPLDDNGLVISYAVLAQVLNGGVGFMIHNLAGNITFSQRGPVGLVQTNLSTAALPLNPQELNLCRVEMRLPTSLAAGSLQVYFNNDVTPRHSVTTDDPNWPSPVNFGALAFGVGARSNVEYFYYRDNRYFCGPNTPLGM